MIHNISKWTYSISFFNVYKSSFKRIINKHDVYRGKYWMKKFYEYLREPAMKIVSFGKKKMKFKMIKFVTFVKKNLKINMLKIKVFVKLNIILIIQMNRKELNIANVI